MDFPDEKLDPYDQKQSQHDPDGEVHSKNLSEYTSLRVSIGMEKKLKEIFRGFQNAEDLVKDQTDTSKQGFSINECKASRQVDVVFFFHGTVSEERQLDLEPQLQDLQHVQLALVPDNTYIYSYNTLPQRKN